MNAADLGLGGSSGFYQKLREHFSKNATLLNSIFTAIEVTIFWNFVHIPNAPALVMCNAVKTDAET